MRKFYLFLFTALFLLNTAGYSQPDPGNVPPSITCPAAITVQCASLVPSPNIGTVTATDNCSGTVVKAHAGDVVSNYICANRFTITRSYTATDVCGNSATCTQIITVYDNTPPTITCPAAITVTCSSDVPQPNIDLVSASDNCNGTVLKAHAGDVISGQICANKYTITRSYTATDVCGNVNTCTQIITVYDNVPPTITCPAAVTVTCASNVPSPNTALVTASDNCNGGTVVKAWVKDDISNQTCANRFVVTRYYRATDVCGNMNTCTQEITVWDDIAPSMTATPTTVVCAADVPAVSTSAVAAWDNCGGEVTKAFVRQFTSDSTCVNRFKVNRIYSATDACGNVKTITHVITVWDNVPPVINCTLDPVTVECNGLQNNIAAANTWNTVNMNKLCCTPNVTDNCNGRTTVSSDFDYNNLVPVCGEESTAGDLTVVYTVTDVCGNSSSITAILHIVDRFAPTFTAPRNITLSAGTDCGRAILPAESGDVTNEADICNPNMQAFYDPTEDVVTSSCQGMRLIYRTWHLTDGCNNAATQTQTILVEDITPPTFTRPADITIWRTADCGYDSSTSTTGDVTNEADNCTRELQATYLDAIVNVSTCELRINRTWSLVDDCGNMAATQTQVITIRDNSAPVITKAPIARVVEACAYTAITTPAYSASSAQTTAEVFSGETNSATASDNCGVTEYWYYDVVASSATNGTCPYIVTRWWTVKDACGNVSASVSQTITVRDMVAPTLVLRPSYNPITVTLVGTPPSTGACTDCLGKWTLNPADYAAITKSGTSTSDNCSSYDQMVPGRTVVIPNYFLCADAVRNWGFGKGVKPVEVRVTDMCGNVATGTSYVKVRDNTAPVMSCVASLTVPLDASGNANIFPGQLNNGNDRESVPAWAMTNNGILGTYNGLEGGSWDACGIDSAWVSKSKFTCADIGTMNVTLYMTDPSKNQGSCTVSVTIVDNIPPVAAPVANIEKTVDPGVCSATVVYPTVTGTDICGATATLVSGLGASGLFPLGTSTEKWTVTDKGGNVVPVEFTVTIKTTNAQPTINQVSAISVPEDSPETVVQLTGIGYGNDCVAQGVTASVAWTNPTLLTNVVLTYVVGSATGNLTHTFGANKYGTATVTVTVKDNSGAANDTKVMEYTVTVTPVNDPPYLVTGKAITDKTVNSAKTITVPIPSALGELFDDVDGDVLTLTATLEGGAALPAWITVSGGLVTVRPLLQHMGTYNIVVKATDPGGLSATNAFKLTVLGYPTSIEPIGDGVFEVKMYPNPTRGKVNLDIEGNFRNVDLTVFNVVGEQILRKQYMAKEKITFDLSGHVTGMYFVRLKTEDEEVVKKLILEK